MRAPSSDHGPFLSNLSNSFFTYPTPYCLRYLLLRNHYETERKNDDKEKNGRKKKNVVSHYKRTREEKKET